MKSMKCRMCVYFFLAIIAVILVFFCDFEFAKNLGYGILASVIVAALIDSVNYALQKGMLEESLDREKMRIQESCRALISDIQKYCKELGLQINERSSFSEMNEAFFVKAFSEEMIYNETFHSFLTERIVSRYLIIRDQLYDLIAFISAQNENMGNNGSKNETIIQKALELISSIDDIEMQYVFHVAFEKNAGFLDLQGMNNLIDDNFIPKAKEMFPELKGMF